MAGKTVPISEVPKITHESEFDGDIDAALKMRDNEAYLVDLAGRKFDSVNVALRGRIKARKVPLHVTGRKDKAPTGNANDIKSPFVQGGISGKIYILKGKAK